jgi:hypothetical protein
MNAVRTLLAAAALSGCVGAAQAADLLGYEIYLGGLHVGSLDVRIDRSAESYRLELDGKARGLVEWLTGFSGRLVADGATGEGGVLSPRSYSERVSFRGDARRVDVGYSEAGGVANVRVDPPPEKDDRDPVPEHLLKEALDPLSGLIGAAERAMTAGNCDAQLPLFDGRRRLDMIFTDAGMEVLKADGISLFSGPARRCRFKVTVLAGAKKGQTRWNRPEDRGRTHSSWIAEARPGGPVVPVRIEAEGAYGWLVVHLVSIKETP